MNLSSHISLQLFHLKAEGEKVHYKVRWTKYKELWEGMVFKGFSNKTEQRMSGNFTTKAGARGFINDLKTIKGFTGWSEIIEYK